MQKKKLITVGIPAFKAEDHICDCLASIQVQTIRDDVAVIIAKDNPTDIEVNGRIWIYVR